MAEEDDHQHENRSSRPHSPLLYRRNHSTRSLEHSNYFTNRSNQPDENSSLLDHNDGPIGRSYRSITSSGPATPRPQRQQSYSTNARLARSHSRKSSLQFSQRLVNALGATRPQSSRRETGQGTSPPCQFLLALPSITVSCCDTTRLTPATHTNRVQLGCFQNFLPW
jgi:hypothetical protein